MDITHILDLSQTRGVNVGRGGTETYRVSFLQVLKSLAFPLAGCLERAEEPRRLREHFMYRQCKLRLEIIQEGTEPLPRCDHCEIHIPAVHMIKHIRTERRNKAMEMRLRRRDVQMLERCEDMEFILYGREGGALVNVR